MKGQIMAELKYKTRGMADPAKKEKVYFCCHPDEFHNFFEEISDEILKRQNCAVWYRDEREPYNEEEHLHDISRMQLFVMPVTTKLLNTKNRALDVDFRFAVENNIPVLPLMQETGLDAMFNEKCGDLQYLDKFSRDATAISYDEKLTKFLEGVLIGDELAEKIRNAFDAYVFLSYRKKDRKYAQELMRLIHQNDFCRDIAIWYDEFLTPGENFNDSIKEALEKSGLFVLAVTPNLVNEENYIMTTEYPMAKKGKKPILPAELVPTDKALLCEKYEDIPECTDARNAPMLSDALLKAVQKMAIKENDDSPQHNFFIGLAYLSGIDVEVDHERAFGLISSAAEAGLIEAQEKLISMYMSGDGVKRNFNKAARWQKKLASAYGERFKEEPTFENLDTWLSCYIGIAGKYAILNKTHEQLEQYLDLIILCDKIGSMTDENSHLERTRLRYKAQGYLYASSCYRSLGRIKETVEYPQKALEILEPLYTEDFEVGSYWIKKDYATCLSYMGESYRLTNDLKNALSYFTSSVQIIKEIYVRYREMGGIDLDIHYAQGLATLGGIHLLNYENGKAADYYLKALAVLDRAEEEHGTHETDPLYIDIALSFSTVYRASGEFESLEKVLLDALEKAQDYEACTGVKLYYSHFRALVFLGQVYTMQKKLDKGTENLLMATELNREYFRMCRRDIDISLLCTCYTLLANIDMERGDIETAKTYSAEAVSFADKCLAEGFDLNAADCSAAYSIYSSLELMSGNVDRGLELLEKAISILEEKAFSMDDTRALPMFFIAYLNYSAVSFDNGDFESTVEYGTKCIEVFEKYRKIAPGIANNSNISFLCYSVGMAKYNLNKKDGREFLQSMCEYFERRISEEKHIYHYDGLATMCLTLSVVGGIFERSKWKKKAFETVDFMEQSFGDAFAKTSAHLLING